MEQLIYDTAIKQGMPPNLARLIVAQAKFESGNFTSPVFKANNNFFGYKYVGQALASKGTAAPRSEGDFYAKYARLEDSVKELTDWIKRRVNEGVFPSNLALIKTPGEYAALLKKKGYYGVSVAHYTNGLQRYYRAIKGISGVLIAAGIALYLLIKK